MYHCETSACLKIGTLYSDAWVIGSYADGSSGSICKTCGKELVAINKSESSTPAIKTAGCSGASKEYTH